MLELDEAAGLLSSAQAALLLHGCVRAAGEREGWCRPWRFSEEQVRTMGSCQAWHPGLFRQMARTTAGVTLEFVTDATEVAVEVLLDAEPTGTRSVLEGVRRGADLPLDGISADVDDRHLGSVMPDEWPEGAVAFSLEDPGRAAEPGLVQLPGLGDEHRVRIWLPALRGCAVRRVWGNGTRIDPVPARGQLLVLGDSIAQGFVTGDPATSWPARLARDLDLDLVNQGLGGQVFQPGTLLGLAHLLDLRMAVVALGENYRYELCRPRPTARDVRTYLLEVARLWPDLPTYVLTPLWHDEEASPSHAMSCWELVPTMIAANVAVHDEMALVDGLGLMDHEARLLADGYGHPTAKGAAQISRRLQVVMGSRQGSAQDRRARALGLLEGAPRGVFPLEEALRRGIGEVVFAQDGAVLLDDGDGQCILFATDAQRAADVAATLVGGPVIMCLAPKVEEAVARAFGASRVVRFHACVYGRTERLAVDPGLDIRPLDESFYGAILSQYEHPEFLSEEYLRSALRGGSFLGGFEGDELVGFVGEHAVGSIGMLEVFEGHRRGGWGTALESAKVNQQLSRGQVPWCEVYPSNAASLALQHRLGFTVLPARSQAYLER